MVTPARLDLRPDVEALTPGLVALRRQLHQHPELAFEEVWTAATLAGRLRGLGLAVHEGLGGTGVLAMLDGARPGKTLLVRADIDGLPMDDTTGRPYASTLAQRNHACGHDVHAAIVVGVADVLARHRARMAGRVAEVTYLGEDLHVTVQTEDGLTLTVSLKVSSADKEFPPGTAVTAWVALTDVRVLPAERDAP